MMTSSLLRRLAAEAVGTAVLAAVLIGSGIRATELSPDGGVRFLGNVLASVLALAVLITLLGPVSGAHFNPLVSAAAWWDGRRSRTGRPAAHPAARPTARADGGLTGRELAWYVLAQLAGAAAGAGLANAMFERPFLEAASQQRSGGNLWLAEAVATGGLILLVFGLLRGGRGRYAPVAVAAWIGAACWGTSSGSFANPALTVGRALSDSYTGIAPGSVPAFVLAQALGAAAGLALVGLLFGSARPGAAEVTGIRDAEAPDVLDLGDIQDDVRTAEAPGGRTAEVPLFRPAAVRGAGAGRWRQRRSSPTSRSA